jgi:peptide/nickel transport system substrate-binding protein
MRAWQQGAILLTIFALTVGCGPATRTEMTGTAGSETSSSGAPVKLKRITAAIRGAPVGFVHERARGLFVRVPGLDAFEQLVHSGLAINDDTNTLRPQLAEALPTLENGMWQVFPDGRMETRWKIRPGATWQDGTPLTTADLLFTTTVEQDKDIGIIRNPIYDLVERFEALDDATISVVWRRPYIEADGMFSFEVGLPMPKHLLEALYIEDKSTLFHGTYWSQDFIGAGPFKVREWVADSHAILQANDRYALGRPKIDEIEVRFIPDPTTLMANVLAGVDMSIGRALSVDQAMRVGEQWREGRVDTRPYGWVTVNPQFINPSLPILADVRFRRALLQGIDRQQLADTLMAGKAPYAHSFVNPATPDYALVEPSIVKYGYDPRAAAQTLGELGYVKAADGMLRDGSGRVLTLEIRSPVQNDIHAKMMASVGDYWQRLGVTVEQVSIPIPRMQDREYVATFPHFHLVENSIDTTVRNTIRFHSSSTPLLENRFHASGNYSRYIHPELDAAIDAYLTTIPRAERMHALASTVRHMSENLSTLPLIHAVTPTVVANRIHGVTGKSTRGSEPWNAHEWEVR